MHVHNLGIAAIGNDRSLIDEPGCVIEPFRVSMARDPLRQSDPRFKPEGAIPGFTEELRRSTKREVSADLHSQCPICGHSYQSGEEVVALACHSYVKSVVASLPTTSGCDTSNNIVLGHRGCVLPRLLTLLASFQPALRFATASRESFDCDPAFGERHSDHI